MSNSRSTRRSLKKISDSINRQRLDIRGTSWDDPDDITLDGTVYFSLSATLREVGRRYVVAAVGCPVCKAAPGTDCRHTPERTVAFIKRGEDNDE